MRDLIAKLERALGIAWADVVDWLRSQNSLRDIELRLATGNIDDVIVEVESAALRFAAETTEAYAFAGRRTAKWLDVKIDDALVRFDVANHRAVSAAQTNQLEFVRGFTHEQRAITRSIVSDGLARGENPRVMARSLRDSIGLTQTQEQHVRNYRRALQDGDWSNALRRELRDKRSDRLLQRLARDGEPLTPKQVNKMVEDYRRRYVAYRAENIARTEALRAANQGHDDSIAQAIARGEIDASQLEEEWHARRRGKRARDQHQAMNGKRVPFGEDFVLPDGTRMRGPGDPRGGARHNAHCACAKSTAFAQIDHR